MSAIGLGLLDLDLGTQLQNWDLDSWIYNSGHGSPGRDSNIWIWIHGFERPN